MIQRQKVIEKCEEHEAVEERERNEAFGKQQEDGQQAEQDQRKSEEVSLSRLQDLTIFADTKAEIETRDAMCDPEEQSDGDREGFDAVERQQ